MAKSTQAKAHGRSQPRGTQRPRPSQSQPSQSQRGRRVQDDEDEDDEGEDVEMEVEGEGDANEAISRRANALVRLALFNEVRRVPLRRDEINKKVLEGSARQFKAVFDDAQRRLQSSFGMELVELMSRAELNREELGNENEAVTGVKKKVAASGAKSYILRSTLHQGLIEAAALTDEQILEDEGLELPDNDGDSMAQSYGSIISWSTSDQLGALGVLYVILALIILSGKVVSDADLKKHFKSFNMDLKAPLKASAHGAHKKWQLDTYLTELVNKNYLVKSKVDLGNGPPKASQGKRGRQSKANDDEDAVYEWKWGTRAHAEVGEEAIAQFIGEFMVERALKDKETEEEAENNSGKKRKPRNIEEEKDKMLETMMKGITRAAGGSLNSLTSS